MTAGKSSSKSTFDTYEPLTIYEFTINLSDAYQYPSDDNRIMKIKSLMSPLFELNTWNYHLKTEISEPKFGDAKTITRVHFHGMIYFNDHKEIRYFLTVQMNKLFKIGRLCINAFRVTEWIPYISKQKHLFHKHERQLANISVDHMLKSTKPDIGTK